jgi:ribosomal-protein-alanine N-acetyltransferase
MSAPRARCFAGPAPREQPLLHASDKRHTAAMIEPIPGVIIQTARLRLRAHGEHDRDQLVALAGDWEVAGWLSKMPHPYTETHAREWIEHVRHAHAAGAPRAFAIALKATDQLIGGVGLDGTGGDKSNEPALGYWVGLPYRGQGYAREAVAAVIGYGFGTLGFETIRALTDADNLASQKVLLACGLSKVAVIDLAEPLRRGARSAPLFRITRRG